MSQIRESLGASLVQAQWIHNAYTLTLSSLILVGGAFADRFGLVRMFSLGLVVFLTASLFCAIAPSPDILVGVRAVQGVGAAIVVPGSLALIARAYPKAIRGQAIGLWAAASVGGLAANSYPQAGGIDSFGILSGSADPARACGLNHLPACAGGICDMLFQILKYDVFRDCAVGCREIPASPKPPAPVALLELGELTLHFM